ncbi:phage tailspike protein [Escherichia coli]|uniref:phage tailspike protein n=2 Tax=Escherichia coli TaxID=562 RepID=UPI003463DAD7
MTDTNYLVSMPSTPFSAPRAFKSVANGKIYIGNPDTDPVNPANQIPVYAVNENGSEVQVSQPIIINAGGFPVYNGQIMKFITKQNFSMAVYDTYGSQQYYWGNLSKVDPGNLLILLSSDSGASFIGMEDGGSVQDFADYVYPLLGWETPEAHGYANGKPIADNTTSIRNAITSAFEKGVSCKFMNGTYTSNPVIIDIPANIEVSPSSFLNFSLIIQGKYFKEKNKVSTTLPWSSVPAGTTNIAGNFSSFSIGGAAALKLRDGDGGSASQGNETGVDISNISGKSGTSLTLSTPTRFPYQNPDVIELQAAIKYNGTLNNDDYIIPGDYTSLFSVGDVIRIENTSVAYSVEAKPYYFELAKIHSINSTGIFLKARLNYTHINPWIVKSDLVPNVVICGGGRIKRLEIRQCDTPKICNLEIDRLIVGYNYDSTVESINSIGVGEPSSINHTYCFGRSRARDLRVGGSSSVTDNAACKFMSCPKMQISGITVDNTTATGNQGDYGVFVDALYTPYYCWNKGMTIDGVIVEKPRSTVNRGVWFYGLLNSVVTNISGGQVFLQGCAYSVFTDINTPEEPMEIRDLVGSDVRGMCKSFSVLGSIDSDFKMKTTGLGTGTNINIACRFGAGVRNPVTGVDYTIGSNNKVEVNSLSESTSAITIQAQSQDGLIIGAGCRDKSSVSSSIILAGSITNPQMEPNKLKGSFASGSGWNGARVKGGINFDGNYSDGYLVINGRYLWVSADNKLKMRTSKPDSDSPSDQIIIGP